jgi:hypothetical protein
MTIEEAVGILEDGNKLCTVLVHTTPAEDRTLMLARARIALQMTRPGHSDPSVLDPESQAHVIAAAETIQKIYYRCKGAMGARVPEKTCRQCA